MFVQDQQDRRTEDEYFLAQVVMRARKEWETFHLQHPAIDEETFRETQRFCVKQWVLQRGLSLGDLSAFERATMHFAYEISERTVALQVTSLIMEATSQDAQSLADSIARQAQERSSQLREEIGEVSSKKVSYLVGKVNQLRAPGQAQDREKAAEARAEMARQDVETIKRVGLAIHYENLKEKLQECEKEIVEQVNYAHQIMQAIQNQTNASEYRARFEETRRMFDALLEEVYPKTLETYHVHDATETVLGDWHAATQRAKHARDQFRTFAGLPRGLQGAITEVLAKAKAEIAQAKSTEHRVHKAKKALERTRKHCAEIEQWAEQEKNQAKERKKQAERDAFPHAEGVVQAKASETTIKQEAHLRQAIQTARKMTKQALEIFKQIDEAFNAIKVSHVNMAHRYIQCAKSLEKVKGALKQAARAAQRYAHDAKQAVDQQTQAVALSDREAEATHAQVRARRTAQQEREAYAQAKTALEATIRYTREIASDQINVQEMAKRVKQHFTALLESHLPYQKDVLQGAITEVKHMVKAAIHVIKQEGTVQAAASQMAAVLQTAGDAYASPLMTSQHEALVCAALANDRLAQCVTSYRIFAKLAADVAQDYLHILKDQWNDSLEALTTYLDEMKQEKYQQVVHHQKAASRSQQGAHLLIDEHTGAITLKDGGITFSLQDLAGIGEVPPEEGPGQSWLLFKDGHTWSSYDVAHDLLHETAEKRTSIHLQVPDGAGGHVAMLSLPNGTQIAVTDIDLEKTEYDPARPECGVTITLRKDGRKINLLAAACAMRRLTHATLLKLVDKSLTHTIDQIRHAVGTKKLEAIREAFDEVKIDDINRKYLDTYILSSEIAEKRFQDHIKWIENLNSAVEQIIYTLRDYGDEALKDEHGDKEITDVVVLEDVVLHNIPEEMYHKRNACLQKMARGKGLDAIITCSFLEHPGDDSTGMDLSPNGRALLAEYERAKAWQVALQRQDPAASGSPEKWSSYLARLRRAILDEAPAYFRTQFLVYEIREAVEMDNLEEGTPENPGLTSLAQELARGPSAVGAQGSDGDNDYARAIEVFTQRVVAGAQEAVKTADPTEIMVRATALNFMFRVIEYAEHKIEDALYRTTPTAVARLLVAEIGNGRNAERKDQGISDQRVRQQRRWHV